jgi:hypothetical protein
MNKSLLIIIIMFTSLFASGGCKSQGKGEYGKPASFSKDKPVSFPDFDIVYTGESSKTSTFPNGNSFTFRYQDFTVSKGTVTKEVKWTTGTGVIEPIPFDFDGKNYTIELRYTEASKTKLADDEMVITKNP